MAILFYVGYNVGLHRLLLAGGITGRSPAEILGACGRLFAGGIARGGVARAGRFAAEIRRRVRPVRRCTWACGRRSKVSRRRRSCRARLRGTGFGLLECVAGVGDVASSVVVGALWLVSPAAAMAWVIVTSAIGAAAGVSNRISAAHAHGKAVAEMAARRLFLWLHVL